MRSTLQKKREEIELQFMKMMTLSCSSELDKKETGNFEFFKLISDIRDRSFFPCEEMMWILFTCKASALSKYFKSTIAQLYKRSANEHFGY
jgi:hypothetical protein